MCGPSCIDEAINKSDIALNMAMQGKLDGRFTWAQFVEILEQIMLELSLDVADCFGSHKHDGKFTEAKDAIIGAGPLTAENETEFRAAVASILANLRTYLSSSQEGEGGGSQS